MEFIKESKLADPTSFPDDKFLLPVILLTGNGDQNTTMANYSLGAQQQNNSSTAAVTDSEWFQIAIPVISLFGILGNLLNLVVLTRRRMVAGMDRLGRTANYGLIALAVSDLLFCITVFPHSFITKHGTEPFPLDKYYRLYGIATINLFIMISTWLIVSMAVKRYIVVVYPLHARDQLTQKRTLMVICAVYVGSIILTLPYFLHICIVPETDAEGILKYTYKPIWSVTLGVYLRFYLRWIWPIIADFIPIVLLVFCNVRLIRELQGASLIRRNSCPGQHVKETNHRVTLTLVIIVLMLLILVSPAEIVKYINPYKTWGYAGYVVASVANLLQTINFSVNFLLYFAVNAKFRQTVRTLLPPCIKTFIPEKRSFSRTLSRTSRTVIATSDEKDLKTAL